MKILKEGINPKGKAECTVCGSELEYENADLYEEYERQHMNALSNWQSKRYYIKCPICKEEIHVPKLYNSENE